MRRKPALAVLPGLGRHPAEVASEAAAERHPVSRLDPLRMKQLAGAVQMSSYVRGKHVLDSVLALGLLLASAPVILAAALLVKLTSRGPAFYSQTRVGLHGQPFPIYKLRTMVHNCESLTGPRWSIPGDPRITPVGHFLRLTHIDELPQLWNVVRGDMSLVGPRPERPEFIQDLERVIPFYQHRHLVPPGISGLAQVQLPADSSLRSVKRKVICDLYYIEKMGFWLDLRILVCTAFKFLGLPFGFSYRLLRLPRYEVIEDEMSRPTVRVEGPYTMRAA